MHVRLEVRGIVFSSC